MACLPVVWAAPSVIIFLIIVLLESSLFSVGGGKVVYYLIGIRGVFVCIAWKWDGSMAGSCMMCETCSNRCVLFRICVIALILFHHHKRMLVTGTAAKLHCCPSMAPPSDSDIPSRVLVRRARGVAVPGAAESDIDPLLHCQGHGCAVPAGM